ncbi:hypothetical protein E5K00_16925 [Hymenobacter aquaticus]|uniref:Uncharacterized protein n=1 Tax=Hymenobacter aquaticus TaxID=1867101 RepID=A0A4Z0PVZ6_9BACT|nr:hypothetical protein [Hymenobacter aquaticus]TGE21940.1 hypothetical protein E5K00_16925 [Hymenobacter aquaticus]
MFVTTFSSLPLAAASGSTPFVRLPAVSAALAASASQPTLAVKQAYKSRELASQAAHRAQVLARRRTSIPTSAKRW